MKVVYPVGEGTCVEHKRLVYRIGLMSYCFVRSTCIVISVVSTALMALFNLIADTSVDNAAHGFHTLACGYKLTR